MKRRTFILGTGAAITFISAGSFAYWYTYDDTGNGVLNPFIQDFLSDEELAKIIEEYLKTEEQQEYLKEQSADLIKNQITNDFILNNVQISDGWVLSETELKFLIQKKHNAPNSEG
nr:hypothetical protein [uncultured Allomuricauda sp.]